MRRGRGHSQVGACILLPQCPPLTWSSCPIDWVPRGRRAKGLGTRPASTNLWPCDQEGLSMLAHNTGMKCLSLGPTGAPVSQPHVLSAQGEGEDGVKLCVSREGTQEACRATTCQVPGVQR